MHWVPCGERWANPSFRIARASAASESSGKPEHSKFRMSKPATTRMLSLLRAVLRCCVVYAVICAIVFFIQRSLLYFPTHHHGASRLTPWVSDGATVGSCREVPAPGVVWLMMHGNAGQASDRDYVLDHLSDLDALYVLEYPGYGARTGSPSRTSIDAAARQAFDDLRKRYPETPVCVIGGLDGSSGNTVITLKETLKQLKALDNAKVRAQNAKSGAGEDQFGVSLGEIRSLAKKIRTDHAPPVQ